MGFGAYGIVRRSRSIGYSQRYQQECASMTTDDQAKWRGRALLILKRCQLLEDKEQAHRKADDVLCQLLDLLGYNDVTDEWEKVQKERCHGRGAEA
jgi:hypothetical protein